jgi:hypothetical protein
MEMRPNSRPLAAGGLLIAVSAAPAALAQGQGGILTFYMIDSPASLSIHKKATVAAERPMIDVIDP